MGWLVIQEDRIRKRSFAGLSCMDRLRWRSSGRVASHDSSIKGPKLSLNTFAKPSGKVSLKKNSKDLSILPTNVHPHMLKSHIVKFTTIVPKILAKNH